MHLATPAPDELTGATLAIRPEDVQISGDSFPEENSLMATVTEIEFRGTGYNLTLHALTTGGTGTLRLEALVSPYRLSELRVRKGDIVKARLPRERVVCFAEDGESVNLTLPGLVVGLSYIFFFNTPSFSLAGYTVQNPLSSLYGTMALLVLCNVIHFYTVGYITASTALRQIDREFELAAESLSVPFYVTFCRVTVPLCLPSVIDIAGYYFVSSMATVSALIFLYTPDLQLASVAVVNMDDAGDTAPAAAMSILIVVTNISAKALFELASRTARRSAEKWRVR